MSCTIYLSIVIYIRIKMKQQSSINEIYVCAHEEGVMCSLPYLSATQPPCAPWLQARASCPVAHDPDAPYSLIGTVLATRVFDACGCLDARIPPDAVTGRTKLRTPCQQQIGESSQEGSFHSPHQIIHLRPQAAWSSCPRQLLRPKFH